MRILSVNAGYFLGYNGAYMDYIRHPLKGIIGNQRDEFDSLEVFQRMVDEKQPDVILLQELDDGSVRASSSSQANYLSINLSSNYSVHSKLKYRGRLMPSLPVFKKMCNAVLYENGEIHDHYLSAGRKGLVQEVKVGELSLFSVHLATFGQRTRRKQLREIVDIVEEREKYFIAGDFNFHKGQKEINYFQKLLDGEVISPGKTFPAKNPRKPLDLAAHSKNIELNQFQKLQEQFSDHQPVLYDIGL